MGRVGLKGKDVPIRREWMQDFREWPCGCYRYTWHGLTLNYCEAHAPGRSPMDDDRVL